ncbi:MAG: hypothetical protein ACI9WU_004799, partial [Myxococcota bacterium]
PFEPNIHSNATEICNAVDDNCDGALDVLPGPCLPENEYYIDADGDGFGSGASVVCLCGYQNGYSQNNTDCDDGDPAIKPGASEICGNGIDENCTGGDATGSQGFSATVTAGASAPGIPVKVVVTNSTLLATIGDPTFLRVYPGPHATPFALPYAGLNFWVQDYNPGVSLTMWVSMEVEAQTARPLVLYYGATDAVGHFPDGVFDFVTEFTTEDATEYFPDFLGSTGGGVSNVTSPVHSPPAALQLVSSAIDAGCWGYGEVRATRAWTAGAGGTHRVGMYAAMSACTGCGATMRFINDDVEIINTTPGTGLEYLESKFSTAAGAHTFKLALHQTNVCGTSVVTIDGLFVGAALDVEPAVTVNTSPFASCFD